jgi:hypothetical protein
MFKALLSAKALQITLIPAASVTFQWKSFTGTYQLTCPSNTKQQHSHQGTEEGRAMCAEVAFVQTQLHLHVAAAAHDKECQGDCKEEATPQAVAGRQDKNKRAQA